MAESKTTEISCNISPFYGYSYYKSGVGLIQRLYIVNRSSEDIADIALEITSDSGFILPYTKNLGILPYESTIEVDTGDISFSSEYLISCEQSVQTSVSVRLVKDGRTLAKANYVVTVLPYEYYCGTNNSPELFSAFVRPSSPEINAVLKSATDILKSWKISKVISGYEGSGKGEIRFTAAAIYRALQLIEISKDNTRIDYENPYKIKSAGEIISSKTANLSELASLYLSALEAAGLNGVYAQFGGGCAVGIWLTLDCFDTSFTDDITALRKRSAEDINEIALIDPSLIFKGGAQNFAGAEKAAADLLYSGVFTCAIDIRRCRIACFKSLPGRVQSGGRYEIIPEQYLRLDELPKEQKQNIKSLRLKPRLSREKQWERRLLDLSLRNSLLNFIPRSSVLHIMSVSCEKTAAALSPNRDFDVLESPSDMLIKIPEKRNFDSSPSLKPLSELVALELKNGRLRTFSDGKALPAALSALYRKERTMLEETGASTLYAACGFLKWQFFTGGEGFKYAPLVLIPLSLTKKTGGKGYTVRAKEEGFRFNTTLLEFLKQEFGIDMRGLDELSDTADITSILAAVKRQILNMKGWEVVEDVYIASLSFARFIIWNDLRSNIDIFKRNKLINSLTEGKLDNSLMLREDSIEPDDSSQKPLYLPINADYSQFKAVALSEKGVSFVLHGPPGTGKSQTITNIIANAVANGRRVLFVAEKMAALSVVKTRLDSCGLGDFCLELHSGKTVKTDIAQKLSDTLALKGKTETPYLSLTESLSQIKQKIHEPLEALHCIRKFGISVYDGILKIQENSDAPDVLDIESPFYDGLTPEKLKNYEGLLSELVSVSRACGKIYRSPFEDCRVDTFESNLAQRVSTSVKVLSEEARHLKAYANLVFEKLGNRVRVLSRKKLVLLKELCSMLTEGDSPYLKIFRSSGGEEALKVLGSFTSAYKDFEKLEERYNLFFRQKAELTAEPEILRSELEFFDNIEKSRPLKILLKRIDKLLKEQRKVGSERELLTLVIDHAEAKQKMARAGDSLFSLLQNGKNDRVNYHQVAELLLRLNKLYETVQSIFIQYDHNSFNATLKNLFAEHPSQILLSYMKAFEDFERAESGLFGLLKVEKDYSMLDEDYTDFLIYKGSALLDNIDLLPGWCEYNNLSNRFKAAGLSFAIAPLKDGKITPEEILSSFRRKVYTSFVENEIAQDPVLSKFTAATLEEKIEKLKNLSDEYEKVCRKEIYAKLISRLPDISTEGRMSIEIMQLQRAFKSNMRGITLRTLFSQIKTLLGTLCPCMLMSPSTVAQYLEADTEMFDIVVFDEASQMPTSEAVGAIARAKSAIIVGDPRQLPPTSFFSADYTDEDNLINEDLESILEDCLALGINQHYLAWHYRSRHESLIAFSNAMYYGNRLSTFPSPDALESKVKFKFAENAVYDRGGTKQNAAEAELLVDDVVRRLKADPAKSIGIVTFSIAQQEIIENKLSDALIKNKLEAAAYEREEPLFVKNLENVQGDERDVILFSICYGPDKSGKLSLNFGPLNQANGWRRLNVAASRAREEMTVFSSMTSAMIDLSKNNSKGVAGLKAFLEYAAGGRTMLALQSSSLERREDGIGKYIAQDLKAAGIDCRYNLGVSGFKIDVAVIDPQNKNNFILAIICDGKTAYESRSIKDSAVMQIKALKRLNWNVMRIWSLNYFANPKREIKKIRQYIEKITGGKNSAEKNKFQLPYEEAPLKSETVLSYYILDKANEKEILQKVKALLETEQPLSREYLIKKCLSSYGIMRTGSNINARMEEIITLSGAKSEVLNGTTYLRLDDNILKCSFYRTDGDIKLKRSPSDISPYEYVAAARGILESRISLYIPDLIKEIAEALEIKLTAEADKCIRFAIEYGAERNFLTKSVAGMITV